MRIKTFRPEKYRDCNIYYRNFGKHFEYLVIINGELYTASLSVLPHRITKLLYLLGIEKEQYSEQQFRNVLSQLRRFSHTTIDYILDPKPRT